MEKNGGIEMKCDKCFDILDDEGEYKNKRCWVCFREWGDMDMEESK